jgi:hypothetical protein
MSAGIAKRGLKPAAVLAEGRPHGTRLRYVGGCRCDLCRAANRNYERKRAAARAAGDWNGIVSSDNARRHLLALARQGVGTRSVSACSDVSRTILLEVIQRKRLRVRARTERAVLAVTADVARGDASLMSAKGTWRLIENLLEEGYTKKRIAQEMGHRSIQLSKKTVTARNASRVAVVYRRLTQ